MPRLLFPASSDMQSFRLIQDRARSGIRNMAVDEAMLRYAEETPSPTTTLRLYRWSPPAVSLGYGQQADRAVQGEFCRRQGIDIVRRPTGGRAVFHDLELTYAVVSNQEECFGGGAILNCYLVIARALHQALRWVGCPAEISPGHSSRKISRPSLFHTPCFLSTSRHEITVEGRKLIGSAQRRLKRSFLQHGSLLLRCDYARQAAALATEADELSESFVGVEEFVFSPALEQDLRRYLARSFEEILQAPAREECLRPQEKALVHQYEESGRHAVPQET